MACRSKALVLLVQILFAAQWISATSIARAAEESTQWWREPFGMLQTNLRQIDADMNVHHVLDYIESHGAIAWLIGVGGIQAQYTTNLRFQKSNPYLAQRESGDLIKDAINATHARGMKLLARMDFSKVPREVADQHPDWLYVSPNGFRQNHTHGLVSVCPSGPYYQERIFDILEEVVARYEVDGFFVNWASFNEADYYKVYHGVCHCKNCQARWREYAGSLPLPNGTSDSAYANWTIFSDEIIEDWTARVRSLISKRLPNAGLILGTSADIMFHEANNAVGRELWHHQTSETVSSFVSYRPEVPVLVNAVSFVDIPYRMGSEEPAHYAQYFLQCISRGGNPSTYIMGTPGKIPYLSLGVAGDITRFHKKWKEVYSGLKPVAKTGLVLPNESAMTAAHYNDSLSEFRGLYTGLQELHVPFDVIGQEFLSAMANSSGLKRYEVMILPDLGALASEEVEALDNWVEAGGRLIVTGSSGVEDGAVKLQSLPAERQLQAISKPTSIWSSYFAPPQNETEENIYTGPIVPIYGTYYKFDWKEGSKGIYKKLAQAPFAPPEYAYGNVQVDERGCGVSSYGIGKGILIPFTVGRGYRELGLRVFRDFFELILKHEGAAKESIHIDIAEQVEVTINTSGSRTVVHLINISGARHQNFGSFLPIAGGSITMSGGRKVTAHALVSHKTLAVKGGRIKLPELGLFEVVVIE